MKLFGLTIASILLMIVFIIISIAKFGLLSCYSAYADRWSKALNLHNVNLWSAVTIVSALLLLPPLIQAGEDNPLQFLGFVTPAYLCLVAFTPRYETIKRQRIAHTIGAALCAILATLWIIFVKQVWFILPIAFGLVALLAPFKTFKYSWLFWAEIAFFCSAWAALLM